MAWAFYCTHIVTRCWQRTLHMDLTFRELQPIASCCCFCFCFGLLADESRVFPLILTAQRDGREQTTGTELIRIQDCLIWPLNKNIISASYSVIFWFCISYWTRCYLLQIHSFSLFTEQAVAERSREVQFNWKSWNFNKANSVTCI